MAIRTDILRLEKWWEINTPINELNETYYEFEKRQIYIYEKLQTIYFMYSSDSDIKGHNQYYNESCIDYVIRFNHRYSFHLDIYNFVPDYYQIAFDYYKQPHFFLIEDNEIPEEYHYYIDL